MQLKVFGQASKTVVASISISEQDYEKDVLNFLTSNNLPIASSCSGTGVCKLCTIGTDILSCKINLKKYIEEYGTTISVLYL